MASTTATIDREQLAAEALVRARVLVRRECLSRDRRDLADELESAAGLAIARALDAHDPVRGPFWPLARTYILYAFRNVRAAAARRARRREGSLDALDSPPAGPAPAGEAIAEVLEPAALGQLGAEALLGTAGPEETGPPHRRGPMPHNRINGALNGTPNGHVDHQPSPAEIEAALARLASANPAAGPCVLRRLAQAAGLRVSYKTVCKALMKLRGSTGRPLKHGEDSAAIVRRLAEKNPGAGPRRLCVLAIGEGLSIGEKAVRRILDEGAGRAAPKPGPAGLMSPAPMPTAPAEASSELALLTMFEALQGPARRRVAAWIASRVAEG